MNLYIRTIRRGRQALPRMIISAIVTLGLTVLVGAPTAAAQGASAGQAIFQSKCASCHTIGGGKLIGPDLKGVSSRRSHDWLVRWISGPGQLIAQGDPTAKQLASQYPLQMPTLGLSAADIDAVLSFINSQGGGSSAPSAPSVAPAKAVAVAGDPLRGREYFSGVRGLQNGGPACIACHSVGGIGALGGGALGPDLTQAYTQFGGDAGIKAILSAPPTPTMKAIWTPNPTTTQEQADIIAFLQQASVSERPTQAIGELAELAVAGMVILVLLAQLVWRRRLTGVRRPMLARAKTTQGGQRMALKASSPRSESV